MISLTLATVLCMPFAATPSETYAEAHRINEETGRPMVVLVGAEWCPACQQMEKQIVPKMRERGLLKRIAFALVDLDRDRELGHTLTSGGPIPQLIFFRRTRDGWAQHKVIGGQSLEAVEQLVNEEIAANSVEMKALAKASAKDAAKTPAKPASLSKGVAEPKAKPAAKQASAASAEKKQAAQGAQKSDSNG